MRGSTPGCFEGRGGHAVGCSRCPQAGCEQCEFVACVGLLGNGRDIAAASGPAWGCEDWALQPRQWRAGAMAQVQLRDVWRQSVPLSEQGPNIGVHCGLARDRHRP
jgi:hypothetical protein